MFRRRRPLSPRPLRPIRRLQRRVAASRVHPGLQRLALAHEAMDRGDFLRAATLYAELADGARALGMPQAAHLSLLAGHALALAGEGRSGLARTRDGLRWLAEQGRPRRLERALVRVLAEMRSMGMAAEAKALEDEFPGANQMSGAGSPVGRVGSGRPLLPGKCPHCGGTVHPEEVDWIDEAQAACDYCGSILTVGADS